MNQASRIVLVISALMVTAQHVCAEEWRGLIPLKSTRADVVRVFGECTEKETYCEFTIEKEDIIIQFASPNNCSGVPADTVLSIQRELQNETTFEALQLDKRRFKSFDPARYQKLGYRGFIDEKTGLLLKTLSGQVFQINYIATKDERAQCRDYYAEPRRFVEVILPHVQTITKVDCPETSVIAGEKVSIVAYYARTGERFFLTWYTTGGRIIEGPTPRKIFLDTAGFQGKEITVTVELNNGFQHTATGSCSFNVSPAPKNQR